MTSAIDRMAEVGGRLWADGDKVQYLIPSGCPDKDWILSELKRDKPAILAFLKAQADVAPLISEIKASLPPGVYVLSYEPKTAPFLVQPASVVTNAGVFFRAYLRDLRARVENTRSRVGPSLETCLAKLSDAGLLLELSRD